MLFRSISFDLKFDKLKAGGISLGQLQVERNRLVLTIKHDVTCFPRKLVPMPGMLATSRDQVAHVLSVPSVAMDFDRIYFPRAPGEKGVRSRRLQRPTSQLFNTSSQLCELRPRSHSKLAAKQPVSRSRPSSKCSVPMCL